MTIGEIAYMQVIYISQADYTAFLDTGCLPRDGAFIRKQAIDVSKDLSSLHASLLDQLSNQEGYRSCVRKIAKRSFEITAVYAQWQPRSDSSEFVTTCLIPGDSIVPRSMMRLAPTESTLLPQQLDTSRFGSLSPNVIETILANVDAPEGLHVVSPRVRAQYVIVAIERLFVIVHWSLQVIAKNHPADALTQALHDLDELMDDAAEEAREQEVEQEKPPEMAAASAPAGGYAKKSELEEVRKLLQAN